MNIQYYLDLAGSSPFATWYRKLDPTAFAKVTVAIARLGEGNKGNAKSIGQGVHEYRIDFGPGYRIYFGLDGAELVILLGGGTKKRQQNDIEAARRCWVDYKRRKR